MAASTKKAYIRSEKSNGDINVEAKKQRRRGGGVTKSAATAINDMVAASAASLWRKPKWPAYGGRRCYVVVGRGGSGCAAVKENDINGVWRSSSIAWIRLLYSIILASFARTRLLRAWHHRCAFCVRAAAYSALPSRCDHRAPIFCWPAFGTCATP